MSSTAELPRAYAWRVAPELNASKRSRLDALHEEWTRLLPRAFDWFWQPFLRGGLLPHNPARSGPYEIPHDNPDSQDLYVYCRHKWVGPSHLAIVEVPLEYAELVIRAANPGASGYSDDGGPSYIIRAGRHTCSVTPSFEPEGLRFWKSGHGWIGLQDITQLWMIA